MVTRLRERTTTSVDERIAAALTHMQPRVLLGNGQLGYRTTVETTIDVVLGDGSDPAAPREQIKLTSLESEIAIPDPVLLSDGSLRFDWETYRFITTGVSTVLFGTDTPIRILMGRGVDPMIRPTLGHCLVPADVTFGTVPVPCVSEVNLVVETPFGRLHNRGPAIMRAMVTSVPPIGEAFIQQGVVKLYSEEGDEIATKEATASTLTGIISS
ncbi:hypothetical protein [Crossiella sp. CA198]|uniref:hypothetical protein n=1 Tax=Crossiella sp. CA198 TaxID=3455607 RepID=UPI003F8D559E